ncbi:MAG: DUF1800 family protein [Bacteroidota bacterium]
MRIYCLIILWCCSLGQIRAQAYPDYLGNGHQQGIKVQSSGDQTAQRNGVETINGFPTNTSLLLGDASRFLAQASFGGNWTEIERLNRIGFESWLEEQIQLPPTLLHKTLDGYARLHEAERLAEAAEEDEDEDDEDEDEDNEDNEEDLEEEEEDEELYFSWMEFRGAWFHTVMTAPDQLRQRVAFALSEMMVISDSPDELEDSGDGLANYYDILIRHGLGNYRDLLLEVSLHPTMGFYLSHFNNPRSDTSQNIHPDENYAREVMQLFSIGLHELNQDGSRKLDAQGQPIPTYSNQDIKEFAKIFTGLSGSGYKYVWELEEDEEPEAPYFGMDFEETSHIQLMQVFEEEHEPGPKYLLNGQLVPAGLTGMQDIEAAIDNLFQHPNVGPFLARHLIQRMVTSNPTPDFIERVARVFADNGQGVRGDMAAVVKAVLTDEEARACDQRDANLNRACLREPILRYMHFCRALNLGLPPEVEFFRTDLYRLDQATGQAPLSANSVFNFFLPDYQPNGVIADLDLFAPEFQIHNSSTAIRYINEVESWILSPSPVEMEFEFVDDEEDLTEAEIDALYEEQLAFAPRLSIDPLLALAPNPIALLDRLNLLLVHGQLSPTSQQIILDAIQQINGARERLDMALYLIMISPDYTILN